MRHAAAFSALLADFLGCVTAESAPPREPVTLETFQVLPPEGQGWTSRIDGREQEVVFLRRKLPLALSAGFTLMRVAASRVDNGL